MLHVPINCNHQLFHFTFHSMQNYYYLLMGTEWREAHDWIHRDAAGNLLPPLVAIVDCAKRNMRDKSVCTAFAVKEHFVTEIEPKLHLMKAIIPDADLLRTVRKFRMRRYEHFDRSMIE